MPVSLARSPLHGPLFRLIVASAALLAVLLALVEPPPLILAFNAVLLSVSGGVMVAYAPVAYGAVTAVRPTRGDFLGLGIFAAWAASFSMRILSICARDLGRPELMNSHWMSATIATALLAGILHLAAPHAVEGRIPRRRWVATGILAAVGIFVALGLWSLRTSGTIDHPAFRLR